MYKLLAVLIILLMIAHLIRPLGLPGLRRRADVWKIGVGLIAAMVLTVLVRP